METNEEARAMSTVPTATIKIDGWWNYPERHDMIIFEEVESMGCADRGGYGSTGVM